MKTKNNKTKTSKQTKALASQIVNQYQFSVCQTLFHNDIKPAEFIKVKGALLLHQAPDYYESYLKKTKEECKELAGKGITGFHLLCFL